MNTQIKFTTAAEAVKVIKSGDHIHLSSVASAPQCLIKAMCERGANHEFKDVHIHHLHTEGPAPYADPQFEGIFQLDSFFVGGNVRKVTQSGYADYIPIFLSETQKLYRSGTVPCDVAMIQVSTPDKHGYVSLGTSVDATLAAVETARTVIAVVNKHVPRSFGDAMIHSSKIDLFVQDDTPLEEAHFTEPNEIETLRQVQGLRGQRPPSGAASCAPTSRSGRWPRPGRNIRRGSKRSGRRVRGRNAP